MMKRMLGILTLLMGLSVLAVLPGLAQPAQRGFGFGGAMGMTFFPDMTSINAFMSENGLPSMGDMLCGAGGNGRGGMIGGPVFGGGGWGLLAFSENDELYAELVSAGGGFDMGRAIGGNERSVLSVGALLGAGANVLSISGYLVQTIEPEGLVPEPTYREIGVATGFIQPYVSMAAQLLPWMGFEFRIGYILPLFEIPFGDLLGIPAPSMSLSGPTVSFGFSFGGIGSARQSDEDTDELDAGKSNQQVTVEESGAFVVPDGGQLVVENNLGTIEIIGTAADSSQTSSQRLVQWHAAKTAREKKIDALQITAEPTDDGMNLGTSGEGLVEFRLVLPHGIDLSVRNGAGEVELDSYEALTVIVENGLGETLIQDVNAAALFVTSGLGEVRLEHIVAETLLVDVGLGQITLGLPVDASARVIARARLGDVDIDRFPGMIGGVRGLFGKSGNVTLGLGTDLIELNVGIGEIAIDLDVP